MTDNDDYDVFLSTWKPSERLRHASLVQNLDDPFSRQRLFADSTGAADVERSPFIAGPKVMPDEEISARGYQFFQDRQAEWSRHFRDYVLCKGVSEEKFDIYVRSFSRLWVDGKSRRQDSPEMIAIKASIRDFDRQFHRSCAGRFVINPVDDAAAALFTPTEMKEIFDANSSLIDAFFPDYLEHVSEDGLGSINRLFVRRGVRMPIIQKFRQELYELSSYSLSIGVVEQFAQTWTKATKDTGVSVILSAPLPAVQERVVAFAPFIYDMDISQLEFVVAPPIKTTCLMHSGTFGGIDELSFV